VRPARGRSDLADWEQCRAGDAGFDVVGLLFDMELWPQGEPAGQRPSSPGGRRSEKLRTVPIGMIELD